MGATLALAAACSGGGGQDAVVEPTDSVAEPTDPPTTPRRPTTSSKRSTTTTTTERPTTTSPRSTTTSSTSTTSTTSTTVAETTTTTVAPTTTSPATTLPPALPVGAVAECVFQVRPGDSLSLIVTELADPALTVEGLQFENAIGDPNVITTGVLLDRCVANGVDDLTGSPRVPPPPPPPPPPAPPPPPPPLSALGTGVQAQQQKLNELFTPFGFAGLTVDGDSGRYTRQLLCAARTSLGLPASRADMEPGGAEEQALMSMQSVSIPAGAPTQAYRWVLIDRTCQVLYAGEGDGRLVFVFPASTGESGYETRDQDYSPVFRYNPARDNGGWHNSTTFPVAGDNPLNGNMYKPLYFDAGQAIHGANNVPPDPRSKGCARLRVAHQDALVDWLGLAGSGPLWDAEDIGVVVSVHGDF